MTFYNTEKMKKLLNEAFEGNLQAIDEIQKICAPFSVNENYSELVLVQKKHATISEDGRIKWLNTAPNNTQSISIADIYTDLGNSWTSVPIPNSFSVKKIENNGNIWSFISNDKSISGTIQQLKVRMRNIVFSLNGSTESELEQAFFSFPDVIVEVPKPQKILEENPPVYDRVIGTLHFNEQVQWFETEYKKMPYSFQLFIGVDERKHLIRILPLVVEVISNIHAVDELAKRFAVDNLLELKNSTWLEEDEAALNEDDFATRLTLDTISFDEKTAYTLSYNDGDLFWGHTISVNFTKHGQAKSAQIQG